MHQISRSIDHCQYGIKGSYFQVRCWNLGVGIVQGKKERKKARHACIDCVYLLCEMRMGMGMGMGEMERDGC